MAPPMQKVNPAKRWVRAQFSSDESFHGVRVPTRAISPDTPAREVSPTRAEAVVRSAVFVGSAEDTVLAELEWAKLGESERRFRDVRGTIGVQGEALDRAYIELLSVGRFGI